MQYRREVETTTKIVTDANGEEVSRDTTTLEREVGTRRGEPDYIKIYTQMFCQFMGVDKTYRELFYLLAMNMSYANVNSSEGGQLVYTGSPMREAYMRDLGWTSRSMYQRALSKLCDAGVIRKISRGVYQINPRYAGKGEWHYNPRLDRGGVEDLIATFDFRNRKVTTEVVWADDETTSPVNDIYHTGLGKTAKVLKTQKIDASQAEAV